MFHGYAIELYGMIIERVSLKVNLYSGKGVFSFGKIEYILMFIIADFLKKLH